MYAQARILYFLILILSGILIIGTGTAQEQEWSNGNIYQVFNNPDNPTSVYFSDCVRITKITNYHWNDGKGDEPGFITLYHESGAMYGPWYTTGKDGMYNAPDVYWIAEPDEILMPGNYLVDDSHPETWSHNDENGNEGMVTILYEVVPCPDDEEITDTPTVTPTPTKKGVQDGTDGITVIPGSPNTDTLSGGATDTEKVPLIEQISFTPLFKDITGGSNVYAMLTVKNIGDRALEDGYVKVSFRSTGNTYTYRGGFAKIPPIAVGEVREIPLIISTEAPVLNDRGTQITNDAIYCTKYHLEGGISEWMKAGYFESRGALFMDDLIEVTGCCQEPGTAYKVRDCTPGYDPVLDK